MSQQNSYDSGRSLQTTSARHYICKALPALLVCTSAGVRILSTRRAHNSVGELEFASGCTASLMRCGEEQEDRAEACPR